MVLAVRETTEALPAAALILTTGKAVVIPAVTAEAGAKWKTDRRPGKVHVAEAPGTIEAVLQAEIRGADHMTTGPASVEATTEVRLQAAVEAPSSIFSGSECKRLSFQHGALLLPVNSAFHSIPD